MAEFCLECYDYYNDTRDKAHQVIAESYLCEGCGEWKPVVVGVWKIVLMRWAKEIAVWCIVLALMHAVYRRYRQTKE